MCALLQMAQLFSRSVGARQCRALFDLDESQILLLPFLGGWGMVPQCDRTLVLSSCLAPP